MNTESDVRGCLVHHLLDYKSATLECIHKYIWTWEITTKSWGKNLLNLCWVWKKNCVYMNFNKPLIRYSSQSSCINWLATGFLLPSLYRTIPKEVTMPITVSCRKGILWSFLWQLLAFFLLHYWWGVPGSGHWQNKAPFTYTFYPYPIKAYFEKTWKHAG